MVQVHSTLDSEEVKALFLGTRNALFLGFFLAEKEGVRAAVALLVCCHLVAGSSAVYMCDCYEE